jgi:hypothetical protein
VSRCSGPANAFQRERFPFKCFAHGRTVWHGPDELREHSWQWPLFFQHSALSPQPIPTTTYQTSEWGRALGEDDPDKVLPFYADDAVLWGTPSPMVRADRAALRDYFVAAFKVLPGLKVAFGDQLIRVYGNAAVNTGYYTPPTQRTEK